MLPTANSSATATPPVAPAVAPSPRSAGWSRAAELGFAFLLGCGVMFLLHAGWQRGFGRGEPTAMLTTPALDLNSVGEAELSQLPGVGPQRARQIVEHRRRHGQFTSIDELDQVPGLGPVTVGRVRPVLRVGGEERGSAANPAPHAERAAAPIDLNTASVAQLMRLPGIGPVLAERIVADRDEKGHFGKVEDLARIPGIKAKTIEKLRPFATVRPAALRNAT